MARDIQLPQRQVGLPSQLPQVKFSTAHIQLLDQVSSDLAKTARAMEDRAAENAYLKGQAVITSEVARMEEQYKNEPEQLKSALDSFSAKFLEEQYDPEVQQKLSLQFQEKGLHAIARATEGRNKIITEEGQFQTLSALNQIKQEAAQIGADVLSSNPAVKQAAAKSLQELTLRTQGIIKQKGPDGTYLLTPQQMISGLDDVVDGALENAAFSWFDNQKDKVSALKKFNDGTLKLTLPNGEGGFDEIDIKSRLSKQTARTFETEARRQISEAKAAAAEQRAKVSADLDIAIDSVDDPKQLIQLQQVVNQNKGNLSPSAHAQKIIRINNKLEKMKDDLDAQEEVDASLAGGGPVDLSQAKVKKIVNKRYEALMQNVPPEQSIAVKTEFASRLGAIPHAMKFEISAGLRSDDPQQTVKAVALYNNIRKTNPELLADIPDETQRFANAISSNIERGYAPEKAIEVSKEMMAIDKNTADARKLEYKDLIQSKKSESFLKDELNSIWSIDPKFEPLMVDDFADAAQQEFIKTGDLETARKTALGTILKNWGRTKAGGNRWMKHPPEKYYSLQNMNADQNSEWIAEQFKQDVQSFGIDHDKATLGVAGIKDDLPIYVASYKDDNGVLNVITGKDGKPLIWKPDKNFIINQARKKRAE